MDEEPRETMGPVFLAIDIDIYALGAFDALDGPSSFANTWNPPAADPSKDAGRFVISEYFKQSLMGE